MQGRRKYFGLALMQVKSEYISDKYDHVLWMNVALLSCRQQFFEHRYTSVNWIHIGVRHMRYFCQIQKKLGELGLCFMSLQISLIFLFFCLSKTFEENSFQN